MRTAGVQKFQHQSAFIYLLIYRGSSSLRSPPPADLQMHFASQGRKAQKWDCLRDKTKLETRNYNVEMLKKDVATILQPLLSQCKLMGKRFFAAAVHTVM